MIYITASTDPTYIANNAQPCVLWRNLLTEGTVANSTLPTTAPRANGITESTFDYWQPTAVPDTLDVSLAGLVSADCCVIAAHTIGSAGASVAVEYYNGSSWVTINTVTPTDNDTIMIVWPSILATGWRIQLTGAVAQIGVVMIGSRLVIPGGVVPGYSPAWASKLVTKFAGVSRRGQFFGQRTERAGARLSPQFMPIPYAYARDTMALFRARYNNGNAFAWASAPSVFPEDVAYCWAADNAIFNPTVLAGGELVSLAFDLEAYAEP